MARQIAPNDLGKMEQYWEGHKANKRLMKLREIELLHPHLLAEENTGIRSGAISKPTENKAMILTEDAYYCNLKRIVTTVEDLYEQADEDTKKIIHLRYWSEDYYDWETIADKVYMSRFAALQKRKTLMVKTMEKIGWV